MGSSRTDDARRLLGAVAVTALRLAALCLAGTPAEAAGAAAAPQAAARTPVTLQLQWYPQSQFAGFMVAYDLGYYADAGLDVELVWPVSKTASLSRVAAGEIDFCTGWLAQAIVLRAQGEPLVAIAQLLQRSELLLIARPGSGIRVPQDLHGKSVGVWGGEFDALPRYFFKKLGIEPEIVRINYSINSLLRGAVDASLVMHYNEYHRLMDSGAAVEEMVTFEFADYGMNFPEDGIYCTETTRLQRAPVCRALVDASLRGWAYALAHESEALAIVMAYCDRFNLPTNINHQKWMLRVIGESIRYRVGPDPKDWGGLDRADYEQLAQALLDRGLIDAAPEYGAFFQPALERDFSP